MKSLIINLNKYPYKKEIEHWERLIEKHRQTSLRIKNGRKEVGKDFKLKTY